MKRTTIILLILLCNMTITFAQESYKESLNGIKKIQFDTDTSVYVKTGTANELIIDPKCDNCGDCDNCDEDHEYHDEHNFSDDEEKKSKKDRAKGLKAIYAAGEDNTGVGIQIERDGDLLRVKDLKSFMQRHGFTLTIPAGIDLSLDCGNLGSAKITGLSSEIEVNTNVGNIVLKDVTGPVTAHTSTGDIDVVFASVNQSAPISISSSVGAIDVSLPANTKANVKLKSTMGSVYSNFDLEAPRGDGLRVVGANRSIEGKLNNGGVNISLKASTGNIYLRKKQ